jgi:ABC-type lipoprotein release transport system permease subunit
MEDQRVLWAPAPPMSCGSSLVKGCGWSRSDSCWGLPVRSPWRRLLTGLLFEIGPWDIGAYLGTIIVLGGAALLATLLPAIRAATIAPVVALRQ